MKILINNSLSKHFGLNIMLIVIKVIKIIMLIMPIVIVITKIIRIIINNNYNRSK
jgi:hypothetical protein